MTLCVCVGVSTLCSVMVGEYQKLNQKVIWGQTLVWYVELTQSGRRDSVSIVELHTVHKYFLNLENFKEFVGCKNFLRLEPQ